jgi:hypothetical protein
VQRTPLTNSLKSWRCLPFCGSFFRTGGPRGPGDEKLFASLCARSFSTEGSAEGPQVLVDKRVEHMLAGLG